MVKKHKSSSDILLILWMMISSANLAYYLFNTPAELDFFGFALPVLSTPFLYLYVRALTFQQELNTKRIIKHAWFYIVYALTFMPISEVYGPIRFRYKISYLTNSNYSHLLDLLTLPIAVVPLVYVLVCFAHLSNIKDKYLNIATFLLKIKFETTKPTLPIRKPLYTITTTMKIFPLSSQLCQEE